MIYKLSWKQRNIITWEEQTHEDIFDDKETAKAFAKVGKDIFGEYDHQITEIGKKEAKAIIAEQKAKKVKELERLTKKETKMNEYKELNRELKTLQTKVAEDIRTANKYTKEIMDLIDEKDELTQSDLQGAVMGIVVKILQEEN